MATFAQRLRELRDQKGLSEARLADASGVAFGAVHDYGLGRRKPSFSAVVKLAKALGVTCEAFSDCEDVQGEEATPGRPAVAAHNPPAGPRLAREPATKPKRPRGRPKKGE